MDPLQELAMTVMHRLAAGEAWGIELVKWLLEQDPMDSELIAKAKWLSRGEPSYSPAVWKIELKDRFERALVACSMVGVEKVTHYWRRILSNCARNALTEYRKGSGTRSGKIKIVPNQTEILETAKSGGRSRVNYEKRNEESSFELAEFRLCIYLQIKRNFSKQIQAIFILRIFHQLPHAEIARTFGVTRQAIQQDVARHRDLLARLVRVNCLGDPG